MGSRSRHAAPPPSSDRRAPVPSSGHALPMHECRGEALERSQCGRRACALSNGACDLPGEKSTQDQQKESQGRYRPKAHQHLADHSPDCGRDCSAVNSRARRSAWNENCLVARTESPPRRGEKKGSHFGVPPMLKRRSSSPGGMAAGISADQRLHADVRSRLGLRFSTDRRHALSP